MTSVDDLSLAGEFPAASREQWVRLVHGVLRRSGAIDPDADPDALDVDAVLGAETYEGLRLRSLYTAADAPPAAALPGLPPYVRGSSPVARGWDVRQRHAHQAPAEANRQILADLDHGVTSLWLVADAHTLAAALDGVYLDVAGVVLDAGHGFAAAADAYLTLLAERGVEPAQASGSLGADPLSVRAAAGADADLDAAVALARRCAAGYPGLRAVVVDALPYHEAGGSDAQELGYALAAGTAYLRALTAAGLTVDQACGQLEFRYAATADQFATIAKLRAARRLWHRVTEVCGAASPQRQHAVTSPAMLTRRDPWVNLLRCTVATFAAGVAGADAITVLPFDAAIGQPEPFALRIARNTHALLVEEAHVARVADPAGGSWFVESYTGELAAEAWAIFQRIERAGGLLAVLADGSLAGELAATWSRRRENLARRRDPITGVSEFADIAERPVVRKPAAGNDWLKAPFSRPIRLKAPFSQLPRVRYAEDFERLRDRGDALTDRAGIRPKVFLATLGPQAGYGPRAGFAANLFQAGGLQPVPAGPTADDDALLEAYRAAGSPPVACLCGTDEAYAERAAAAEAALAGARLVLTAGRGELRAGCDAIAVLDRVYDVVEGVTGG